MKVLFADDDLDILDITTYALRRDGFTVSAAADGDQALRSWRNDAPDVVLLDVRMPKIDGFEVLRTIRQTSDVPVIMLTAKNDEEDVVRGLQLGADDYVTKPFSPRQLCARIRTVARRGQIVRTQSSSEIEAAGLVLDIESHEVQANSHQVRVTPTEFRILHPLMLNAGRVVPSSRLVELAWGFEGGDSTMLKTHICHIRKKLRLEKGEPGYIENIPGVGYVFHR